MRERLARLLPQGRKTRLTLMIIGGILIAVPLAAIGLRQYSTGNRLLLAVTAMTPHLLWAVPVGLLLMLLVRQWWGALVAVLVIPLGISTQVWLYTSQKPPKNAQSLQVLTANLHVGAANPAAVVDAVRKHHVDVLMVEELTEAEAKALKAAGLYQLLPYHALHHQPGASGTGLYSHFAMSKGELVLGYHFTFISAHIWLPRHNQGKVKVQVVALHLPDPVPDPHWWLHDFRRLAVEGRGLSHDLPAIIAGDFNATPDVAQYRSILSAGFHDAADQSGAGYVSTYPNDRWYPPLLAIDHVLTRNGPVTTRLQPIDIRGTDHRALLATVAVPMG